MFGCRAVLYYSLCVLVLFVFFVLLLINKLIHLSFLKEKKKNKKQSRTGFRLFGHELPCLLNGIKMWLLTRIFCYPDAATYDNSLK